MAIDPTRQEAPRAASLLEFPRGAIAGMMESGSFPIRLTLEGHSTMLDESQPIPTTPDEPVPVPAPPYRLKLDEHGHLIPPTEAELPARIEAMRRMIEAINSIPNAPGEDDRDFFRTIDEQRPHRPLFEGMY